MDDIDVYTGALSEPPMEGAILGTMLACLLTDQFLRIKKGDSHWYERSAGPQMFTNKQLNEIYDTTLAAIICRNSDAVNESQRYVMRKAGDGNEILNCSSLDTFNFIPWKEKERAVVHVQQWNYPKVMVSESKSENHKSNLEGL